MAWRQPGMTACGGAAALACVLLAACPGPVATRCTENTQCPAGYGCDESSGLCQQLPDATAGERARDAAPAADAGARDRPVDSGVDGANADRDLAERATSDRHDEDTALDAGRLDGRAEVGALDRDLPELGAEDTAAPDVTAVDTDLPCDGRFFFDPDVPVAGQPLIVRFYAPIGLANVALLVAGPGTPSASFSLVVHGPQTDVYEFTVSGLQPGKLQLVFSYSEGFVLARCEIWVVAS